MDIELTPEYINDLSTKLIRIIDKWHGGTWSNNQDYSRLSAENEIHQLYMHEVFPKLLSLLEPVELEALGDEEIRKAEIDGNSRVPAYGSGAAEHRSAIYDEISQATIRHNQSQGTLYRLKEKPERAVV